MSLKTGSKKAALLKGLITFYHPSNEQALLRFLPPNEQEFLNSCTPLPKDYFPSLFTKNEWMEEIHYSWLLPKLKLLPAATQALLIQSFPKEQRKRLKEKLKTPEPTAKVSEFLQNFLVSSLKNQIFPESSPPLYEVPFSEMKELLRLTKGQLVHLIDLLGIHDLASDLRQIVDRNLLAKVHAALTQEHLHFLHYCLKQPLKWIPPKLNIISWDGDAQTLNLILHQRGLIRLGKALGDEHPTLQWHICHRLDTGRSSILMKVFAGKQDPAIIPYFKAQVLHLVRRY